jgi:hypothetical protein
VPDTKKTLPAVAASVALYVLAIAAEKVVGRPLAWALFVGATFVLALVGAGFERVQRHFPDLGRLPLVTDHGFYKRNDKASDTHPNGVPPGRIPLSTAPDPVQSPSSAPRLVRASDVRRAAANKVIEESRREAEQRDRLKQEVKEELAAEAREADPMMIKVRQHEAMRARERAILPTDPGEPNR